MAVRVLYITLVRFGIITFLFICTTQPWSGVICSLISLFKIPNLWWLSARLPNATGLIPLTVLFSPSVTDKVSQIFSVISCSDHPLLAVRRFMTQSVPKFQVFMAGKLFIPDVCTIMWYFLELMSPYLGNAWPLWQFVVGVITFVLTECRCYRIENQLI